MRFWATHNRPGKRAQLLAARGELMAKENELTTMGGELAQQRRRPPWMLMATLYGLMARCRDDYDGGSGHGCERSFIGTVASRRCCKSG